MTPRPARLRRLPMRALVAGALSLQPVAASAALGPAYGGTLRLGVLDLPANASPSFDRGLGSRLLFGLRHETLVRLNERGAPEAAIAAHWSAAEGGREWSLELDRRASFHDGRAVTAGDVVASLRRFLRSSSPAAERLAALIDGGEPFRSGRAESLPGVAASEAGGVVLRLVSPTPDLPPELAAPAAAITASDGAGCGPFLLVHAVRDERAALVPFARHVAGRPFLDEVEILRFRDREALSLALAKGSVDVALGEPGKAAPRGRLLLVLDATRPLFRDAAARQRVAVSIDRRVLAERFLPGGQPLCRLWWESGPPPACDVPPSPPSGPGFRDAPLDLVVDRAVPASASRRVVAHLMALGYAVTVRVMGADAAASSDADARLLLWLPEIDLPSEAVAEAAALPGVPGPVGEGARDAAAHGGDPEAAERTLLDSASVIPLAAVPLFAAPDPRIRGLEDSPTAPLRLDDAWRAQ